MEKHSGFLSAWFILSCRGVCLAAGGFFCSVAVEESFVHPRIHPVSSLYASFSSRWDEFGQNRRGSESAAGPRCGPRVSFTENFKQQPRNFRELKQRVFRHRVGRYTVRALWATLFLLLSAITVYFTYFDTGSYWCMWRLYFSYLPCLGVVSYSHCSHDLFPWVAEQNAEE